MSKPPTSHFYSGLRVFGWQALRDARRHPLLALLNIISVALGIAVFLAIQIANRGANQSFAAAVDLVSGKAHLEVRGNLDESLWPLLARQPGVAAATGLVEGNVTLPDRPGEYLRILGIDLFSGEPFRTFSPPSASGGWNMEEWFGKPGGIVLPSALATQWGVKPGAEIKALAAGKIETLHVVAVVDASDSPGAATQHFALMDIGWAQELFAKQGKLSAVQIRVADPNHAAEAAEQLATVLPPDLRAEAPRQRGFQLQHMVSAFELNLSALSMVSLLVGVFLIYNTVSAAVTRRRREIGILRSVGATRWTIRWLFLGEALVFGALGIALGFGLGVGLAQLLTGAVARTISSLYVLLSIGNTWPGAPQLALAALFGFAAVIAGAWLPANEAANVDPISALHPGIAMERNRRRSRPLTLLALASLAAGGVLVYLTLHGASPLLGFGAALAVVLSAAFAAHGAVRLLASGLVAVLGVRLVTWRLSAENFRRSVHRNRMTVAALSAAIAMLTGLAVMIYSFRETVNAWIAHGIVADLFIGSANNEQAEADDEMPPRAIEWLRRRPEVDSIDTIREQTVRMRSPGANTDAEVILLVIGGRFRNNLEFQGGRDAEVAARVFSGPDVAVTESFARKYKAQPGDSVNLQTPAGPRAFHIAGIYADYSRDQGVVLMGRGVFDQFWREPGVQSLAVFLKSHADAASLAEAFRSEFSREGEFSVYQNSDLRERILNIFDQTFAVTSILRIIACLVAIIAVYLSVVTLIAEREREISVLRAVGASAPQIQLLLIQESILIALVASVLGLLSGAGLAVVLTKVINPAFFGWTIVIHWPGLALWSTPAWVVAAAALAAWRPAWTATRNNIALGLRSE